MVDVPGLERAAQRIEVVLVARADVVHQVVVQRGSAPAGGKPVPVTAPDGVQLTGGGQILEHEIAHGAQQPGPKHGPATVGGDVPVADQPSHHGIDIGPSTAPRTHPGHRPDHGPRGRQVERPDEHREPAQRHLLHRVEPIDAPAQRVSQRTVARRAVAVIRPDVEWFLDQLDQFGQRVARRLPGHQLERQRQPVHPAHDPGQRLVIRRRGRSHRDMVGEPVEQQPDGGSLLDLGSGRRRGRAGQRTQHHAALADDLQRHP